MLKKEKSFEMVIKMPRRKTKKNSLKPLIFEALKEKRTVPEVMRHIREKHGIKDLSTTIIYHHIRNVEKGKEKNYRVIKDGNRYQFILKDDDLEKESKYFIWFIDKYNDALDRKDQDELYILRSDLEEFCRRRNYSILDENILDFLIENVKKDSY